MMIVFETIADARLAITNFLILHSAGLAEDLRGKVMTLSASPSPVDQIVRTAELLYANRDDIGAAGRNVAGGLAAYAAQNGWHGMNQDNRGGRIMQAMARENNEAGDWPTSAMDPVVAPEHAPATIPPPVPA